LWHKERVARLALAPFGILVICVNVYHMTEQNTVKATTVLTVETSFTALSQQSYIGYLAKKQQVLEVTEAALRQSSDYVLLPEDSRLTMSFSSPQETLTYLKRLSPDSQTVLVDTTRY